MSRVSVFVDGENIPASQAPRILGLAHELGQVELLRVYGDAGLLGAWDEVPGFRLIHSGSGKNAADLLLSVDAMERALDGACDTVVIASSDGDFRHLAGRLRERGLSVIGMGRERAGLRFKAACSRFVVLRGEADPAKRPEPAPEPGVVPFIPPGTVPGLTKKIIAAIAQNGCPRKGLELSALQVLMYRQHRVAIGCYPEKTWRGYLQARGQIFVLDPKGPEARVRLRETVDIAAE